MSARWQVEKLLKFRTDGGKSERSCWLIRFPSDDEVFVYADDLKVEGGNLIAMRIGYGVDGVLFALGQDQWTYVERVR